jgi:hypothetical protein
VILKRVNEVLDSMFLRPRHVVCIIDLAATEAPWSVSVGTRRRVGLDKVDDGER